MNTYYYDTDFGSDARLWSDIVSDTIIRLHIPVGQREFNPVPEDGVVFIHHSSLACTEAAANELTTKYPSAIFVWIFGGGLQDAPVGARYYSIRAVVHKPSDVAFKKRVADFLEDYEKSKTPSFLLLEPESKEPVLAICLLCEAWSEVNLKTNNTLSGFPIHAPSKLDDWLAPFAPEGNDDAAKIASVVSNMGDNDTKERVRKVLESANTDPTAAVKVLLKMPQTPEPTESEA